MVRGEVLAAHHKMDLHLVCVGRGQDGDDGDDIGGDRDGVSPEQAPVWKEVEGAQPALHPRSHHEGDGCKRPDGGGNQTQPACTRSGLDLPACADLFSQDLLTA